MSKMILRKKNRAGGIMFPEFRLYLQTDSQQSESEVAQSCPTLCDPMDWSLPGSANTLLCFAHFKPPLIFLRPGFSTSLIHRNGRPRKKKKKVIISNDSGALLDPVICVLTCTVKA